MMVKCPMTMPSTNGQTTTQKNSFFMLRPQWLRVAPG